MYPDTSSVAYYINSFIANRDFIDCVVLTGLDQTLYSTERAYTDLSDFNIIRQKWWFPKLKSHENAFDLVYRSHLFCSEIRENPGQILPLPPD